MTETNQTEPEKQYALVQRHIQRLRDVDMLASSPVIVMVERNLGFEVTLEQRNHLRTHLRFCFTTPLRWCTISMPLDL